MNNIANKTTFWAFLGQTKIVIPRLQRDYAQGRKGKESLREDFLVSIKEALDGDPDKALKLDFVYGCEDEYGNYTPLDGQQRLTTLWLLHWYLAFKSRNLSEIVQNRLKKFTYETRESSSRFCEQLVLLGSTIIVAEGESIADAIIRQSWMFSAWRQDPTIQSMLRMLSGEQNDKTDGIEELFSNCSEKDLKTYWEKLQQPANSCPIVFYQLDIENLGQTDDLYVKMNGRGKPLTDFENFKADLINYFEEKGWTDFLNPEYGYPVLMDTNWTDYFWGYKNTEISVDDLFFAFVNRFFLVRLMLEDKGRKLEESKEGSVLRILYDYLYSFNNRKQERQVYNDIGFGVYKTLFEMIEDPRSMFYDLRNILNNLYALFKNNRGLLEDAVNNPYYENKQFKIVYVDNDGVFDGYSLTQPQIVAFWAVCHYFSRLEGKIDYDSLKEWMRIVWNTCDYNDEIRSKGAIIANIQAFKEIVIDPTNAIESLATPFLENLLPTTHPTAFDEHIREERSKIGQFRVGCYSGRIHEFLGLTWKEVILRVEKMSVFNGNIRCLILDEDNHYNWAYFDTKYENYIIYNQLGLGSVAIRNLLLFDFELIKRFWFPKGEKRDKYWRSLFVEDDKKRIIHEWLLVKPKDNSELEKLTANDSDYHRKKIIGTPLLAEATNPAGMYLAYSRVGKWALIHHQMSSPYVLFYETRDKLIQTCLSMETIRLVNNEIKYPCGLFNSRDLWFEYQGKRFVWLANGHVRKETDEVNFIEGDECCTPQDLEDALKRL